MFRSIYSRMLVTYLLIIAFILLFQSVLLVQMYKNDYYNSAKKTTLEQANQIAKIVSTPSYNSIFSLRMLLEVLEIYTSESNHVWIIDRFGNVITVGGDDILPLTEMEFKSCLLDVLNGKEVVAENIFQSRFSTPMLSIGVPVKINDEVKYAVFVHSEIEAMEGVTYSFYRHIFISAIIAALVSTFLVLLSSKNITSPIKEIRNMTIEIAQGRFDKHIKIDSNDEIGELAQAFNDMAINLRKQEELRSDFVANVSHELRSPLTSIHGFAQGMMDGTIESNNREQYIQIILDETTRLKKLITELLDLSQIESGKFPLHLQEFDINEQIRRVIIMFIDRMEDNEIDLDVDFRQEVSMVFADADRIQQILVNLIDNAIKFTPPKGTISVWTHCTDDKVLIGVGDTGDGIQEQDLPYIFERFYKSDKAHTEKTGTGLGLSIVKRILDQHGQDIKVNSTIGKGTKFVFTLETAGID